MSNNFDQLFDRRATNSIKWNFYPEDVLPMWVADMDFQSPAPVIAALLAKVEHGIFGYELPSEELINTVCERMKRLYHWDVAPQHVIAVPGLVTGINVACRAFARPGDGVIMNTPVYPPFLSAPQNNQQIAQQVPLTLVGAGRTFHYDIDYDAFEAAITPQTRLFLLCHPHNPIGQIWDRDQLTRLAEICLRHNVVICSDEIHAELPLAGNQHIPLATISSEIAAQTVTLIAPSKTFNIAGLGCAFAIVSNPDLRQKMRIAAEGIVPHNNALGLAAALAAYRDDPEVNEWHAALLQYLTTNRDALVEYVTTQLPTFKTTIPQATYLGWLDCRETGIQDPHEFFLSKAKVGFNDGFTFGDNGTGLVRINFGCPRSTLMEGLERVKRSLLQP
jgi:cystathionine beta-lyase